MRVLLAYPRGPDTFWSLRHALSFVAKRAAFPPLGLLTVAAMLPRDWELKLVDTNVAALADRDIAWAGWVMLSGMIVHKDSARDIARRCAALARPGRLEYWRLFWSTLVVQPRKLHLAMELAIIGHHFRTVARKL